MQLSLGLGLRHLHGEALARSKIQAWVGRGGSHPNPALEDRNKEQSIRRSGQYVDIELGLVEQHDGTRELIGTNLHCDTV